MVRTERLSEQAQDVLRLLAVAQRADHALLADAGELDGPSLRTALREAAAAHMIGADQEGWYRFRHALLREVVHDDLLPGEHAELHLALAQALERRAQDAEARVWVTAGMAHHYRSAGDQPSALRASVVAADAAAAVWAQGEAAALLERALELWDRVPGAEELAGATHAELLVRTATAHRSAGDDHRRLELLRRALEEIDAQAEPGRAADVLGELASAQWSLGRGEDSRATLREALELVPREPPSVERAELISRQVAFLMLQGRYREVGDAADEALRLARGVGAEELCSPILNRLGVARFALGDEAGGQAAFDEAAAVAVATGQRIDLAFVHANLSESLHRAGRSREALDVVVEAARGVEAFRPAHWIALQRAEIEFSLGEWEAAERHLPTRRRRMRGSPQVYENLVRSALHLGRGDTDAARRLLEETERLLVLSLEPQFLAGCGSLRAELALRADDVEAARRAVDDAIDRIEFCSEDGERLAEVARAGVAVDAEAAVRARDLGDAEAERLAVTRAEMMDARVQAVAEDTEREVPRAHALTSAAELTRALGAADPSAWAAAAGAWTALERPYPAALARWREAEAHLQEGDREATVVAARASATGARELGSAWLLAEVEGLAARARLRLAEPGAERAAEPPPDEEPFGLTARERQVLVLLAGGATNREIGARLYMAEKTASVHVSRILSKLDVRSRTEAAAVAHRHGLEREARVEIP
jgi:DNA-binding NarL/FixJ family response regulator